MFQLVTCVLGHQVLVQDQIPVIAEIHDLFQKLVGGIDLLRLQVNISQRPLVLKIVHVKLLYHGAITALGEGRC